MFLSVSNDFPHHNRTSTIASKATARKAIENFVHNFPASVITIRHNLVWGTVQDVLGTVSLFQVSI